MKSNIFSKVFTVHLVIVILLSALIVTFTFRTIRTHRIETLATHLMDLDVSLRPRLASYIDERRGSELDSLVKGLGRELNVRITVVDRSGAVLADSEKDPASMENHLRRPEILRALGGSVGRSLRFSETVGEDMLYVAIPLESRGEIAAVLRTSLYLSDIDRLLGRLRLEIVLLAAVVAGLALVGALIFSRGLTRPIRRLQRAARAVGAGDFNVRVLLKGRDEIRELADGFNRMTDEIRALFSDLSLQKEELDGIVSSIQEGILLLDREGRIKLFNRSFLGLIRGDVTPGAFHWEVLRETGLTDLIRRVEAEKRNRVGEIEFHDRSFLASVTFILKREEIVVVLHDITEIRNLERVKKDFVANVSHEIRTPLTAIAGFVETLEGEVNEEQKRYLGVIKRHTERLSNLVKDLGVLSELEESQARTEFREVDLRAVAEDVLLIFRPRIEAKGLSLSYDVKEPLPRVRGDSLRLEQLLINLLDNAVKYTEKGEVRLILSGKGGGARIEVEDTGIGIPKEDQGRIFERFYVVDKSRSKRMGGTGLGLSIVKHIVLLHGGEIGVESRVGEGTRIAVDFPPLES